jgi:uncharacterized protein RhaS with RHS repeats
MKMKNLIHWRYWLAVLVAACWLDIASAYYDPGPQRWINRDPIGEVGGVNLYRFVLNTPVGRVDAKGLLPDLPDAGERWLQDCLCVRRVAKTTQQALRDGGFPIGNEATGGNAFQHCLISCRASKECGTDSARTLLTDYENQQSLSEQTVLQREMDLKNNEVGYAVKGDCAKGCADAWRQGALTCINPFTREHIPCPAGTVPEDL